MNEPCARDDPHIIQQLCRLNRNSMMTAYCHFEASDRAQKQDFWLGVPVILINVLLGSVLVADINKQIPIEMKWISAILALVASLLAALQTFFNPRKNRSLHKQIGNRYLGLERKIDIILSRYRDGILNLTAVSESLPSVIQEYEEINVMTEDCPASRRDYRRAKQKIIGWEKNQSKVAGASGNA